MESLVAHEMKNTKDMENSSSIVNYVTTVSEIQEEGDASKEPLSSEFLYGGPLSSPFEEGGKDDVYIAVGRSKSSMEALVWALKNLVTPTTFVFLIHVFPEVHFIPTLLGKLPKSQVTPSQIENHVARERYERRLLLEKFLNLCTAYRVNVDTVIIESDMTAKAIMDLIPVLHIKKLVMGATKYSLKKGSGKAVYVQGNAPEYCHVSIICDGNEVMNEIISSPPSTSATQINGSCETNGRLLDDLKIRPIFCTCFSSKDF